MTNRTFYLAEGVEFQHFFRLTNPDARCTWTVKLIEAPAASSLSNRPTMSALTGRLMWHSPLPSISQYTLVVRAENDGGADEVTVVVWVSTPFSAVITSASIDGNTVNITNSNLTSSDSVNKTTLVAASGFPSTMLRVSGTLVAPETIDHMLLFIIVDDKITTYSVAVNPEMSRFDTVVQLSDTACGPIQVGTSHPAPTMYNDVDNLVSQFQIFIVSIDTLFDSAPLPRSNTIKTSPVFGQGPTVLTVVVVPCWQESVLQSFEMTTTALNSKRVGPSALQVVLSETFVDGSQNISIFAPTDVSVATQRTSVWVNVTTTVVTPILFPGDYEQRNETIQVTSNFVILVDPIIPSVYLVASASAVHAQILLHSDAYSDFFVDLFNEGNEDAADVMVHLEVDELVSGADITLTSPTWLPQLAIGGGHRITVSALYPALGEQPVPLQAMIRVTSGNGTSLNRVDVPIVLWPSSEVGTNVSVYLFDEYTVYDPKSPPVTNLQVEISVLSLLDTSTISSELSSTESVKKFSDENGLVMFEGLQPGYYHVTVTPDKHHRQPPILLLIISGEFTIDKRIFVPRRLTDVRWRVVPSAYIDRYLITLDVTFATHVPAPVVIVSPAIIYASELLQDPSLKVLTFNVTNVGLIAADFSVLTLPSQLGEFIRLEVPEGGIIVGRIPALTSVMVSVNITIDDSSRRHRRQTTISSDKECQITRLDFEYDCAGPKTSFFPITFKKSTRTGTGSDCWESEPPPHPSTQSPTADPPPPSNRCIPDKNCGCQLCRKPPPPFSRSPSPPSPPTPRVFDYWFPKFGGIIIPRIAVDAEIPCSKCLKLYANMLIAKGFDTLNEIIEAQNHIATTFAAVGFGKLSTIKNGRIVDLDVTSEQIMNAAMYGAGKFAGSLASHLLDRRRNSKDIASRRRRGSVEDIFNLGWSVVCKLSVPDKKHCDKFSPTQINEKLEDGAVFLSTALCTLFKRKRRRQLLGPTKLLTEDAAANAYIDFVEQVQAFNDIRAPVLYLFGQNTSGDPHWLTELMDSDDSPSVSISLFVATLLNASDDNVLDFEEWSYLTQLSQQFNSPHLYDDIQHSLHRWNNTIRLNALGIYTVADFQSSSNVTDDTDLTLFAATDTFKSKSAVAVSSLKQASDKGYTIAPFSGVIESYNKFAEVMARPVQDGVCAKVRIRIEQEVVFTRFAVRAELELENFQTNKTLRNVSVSLEVLREAINSIVPTTFEGLNSSIHDFAILLPTVEMFSPLSSRPIYVNMFSTNETLSDGVDGLPDVPPLHRMKVVWVLVPSVSAAPTEPQVHLIGGKLSYVAFIDAPVTEIVLHPTPIRVLPSPLLELAYFAPSQLEGDDPFTTDVVEPSKPAPLCVVVHNRGFGDAISLQITSSQPKIVDNEKGLAVSFRIAGSFVNQQETSSSSLSVDFGTIVANSTSVACWYLVSSLQGQLSDMKASFQQLGPLGQLQQPLIDKITTNTHLLRLVRLESRDVADDGVADLLYRDPSTEQLFVLNSRSNDAIEVTDYPISLKHQPRLGIEGRFEVTNELIVEEGEVHFNLQVIRQEAGNATKHYDWTLLSIETTRLQSLNGPRTFAGGNRTCFIKGVAEKQDEQVYFGGANVWVDRFRLNIKGQDAKTEHWLRIFDYGIADNALNCTYTLKWKGLASPPNLRLYRGTETVPEEGAIAVQWDRVADATGYQVEWKVEGAAEFKVFEKLVIGLGVQLVNLPLNKTLEIQVRSRRNGFLQLNGSLLFVASTTSTASMGTTENTESTEAKTSTQIPSTPNPTGGTGPTGTYAKTSTQIPSTPNPTGGTGPTGTYAKTSTQIPSTPNPTGGTGPTTGPTGSSTVSPTTSPSGFESTNTTSMLAFVFQQQGIRYYHAVIHKDIVVNSEILMLVVRHTNISFDTNITYVLDDKEGIFDVDAGTGNVTVVSPVNQSMIGFHMCDVIAMSTPASGPHEVVYSRLGVYILSDLDLIFMTIQYQERKQQYNQTIFQDVMSIAVCPNATCTVTVWNETADDRRRDSSQNVRVAFYVTDPTLTPSTSVETPSPLNLIPRSIVMNAIVTAIQDGLLDNSSSEFQILDLFSPVNIVTPPQQMPSAWSTQTSPITAASASSQTPTSSPSSSQTSSPSASPQTNTPSASSQTTTPSPNITTSESAVFEESGSQSDGELVTGVVIAVVVVLVILIAAVLRKLFCCSNDNELATREWERKSSVTQNPMFVAESDLNPIHNTPKNGGNVVVNVVVNDSNNSDIHDDSNISGNVVNDASNNGPTHFHPPHDQSTVFETQF